MLPKKRKPTHPGRILEQDYLKPLMMSPEQFANALGKGWTAQKVNDIIAGKGVIPKESYEDFAQILGTPAHFWKVLHEHERQWEEIQKQNEKGSQKAWKKAQ